MKNVNYAKSAVSCLVAGLIFSASAHATNTDQIKTDLLDTKITTAVKAKILSANASNDLAGKNNISVSTKYQTVKLTGCTTTKHDKLAIEDIAKNTDDVANVINKITVRLNCK